jgi:hypothetical protein
MKLTPYTAKMKILFCHVAIIIQGPKNNAVLYGTSTISFPVYFIKPVDGATIHLNIIVHGRLPA